MKKELKSEEKCDALFTNKDAIYRCERPKHTIYPSARHWSGGVHWTQGGADRIARELAAELQKLL